MFSLQEWVRPNIWALKPYSSARDEYKGIEASVFLDANESPYNSGYNRYPDPLQEELKGAIAPVKNVPASHIFLGNGSDEAIDLVFRIFCTPEVDNVVAISPTYGMYEVCADINGVEYRSVPLDERFQLHAEEVLKAVDGHTKAIFLCTPNNPTGNTLDRQEVLRLLQEFGGIAVIDEAYSDFSAEEPWRFALSHFPNLIVLNTFSKAWASAAIRLGMAFASEEIIALFNKVKYPYNINQLTQRQALDLLSHRFDIDGWVRRILEERGRLMNAFALLPTCQQVYPTQANFFLARMTDAEAIYRYLVEKGIIVRNRNRVALCQNCLRITIGTPQENSALLGALRSYKG